MEHVVTPSEEKKGFDYEGFVKKWLWLVAIVFAAIVFIGLAFPQFEANAIEVTGGPIVVDGKTTSGYIFTALDEVEYGFGALFANGGNWMVLWLYFLPLISLILLIISPFCGKYSAWLSLTAAITSLVAGILFFISPTLFAYGECWQAIGNDIALDYGDPGFIYLNAAAPQFLPGTIVIASLSLLSSLISFSLSASLVSISIRDISEIGILSALAIALQFIKIQVGPDGGSINLGLVPLCMIALRHGPTKGFIAGGLVYGIITCLTDGYGFQTYPFDYLIGFGSVAEVGFFSKLAFKGEEGWNPLGFLYVFIGVVLATAVRLVGSTISSMVIYGYDLVAALAYNGVYIPVTGLVTLVCLEALYVPIAKVNKIFPVK